MASNSGLGQYHSRIWIDGQLIQAAPKAPERPRALSVDPYVSSLCAPSAWRVDFIALLDEARQSGLDQLSAQRTETNLSVTLQSGVDVVVPSATLSICFLSE
jgi:hypothetical protein